MSGLGKGTGAVTDEGRGGEYQRRVLALDHSGLLELWQGLRAGVSPPEWPAGVLLEYLLLRAFQQIDGIIYFDGVSCLVESKDVTRTVDAIAIVKLKSQLLRRPRTTIGAVFNTGTFSPTALSLLRMLPPPDVLLWEGEEIDFALQGQRLLEGMRRKLRHAVETGFADLDLVKGRNVR